MSPKSNNLSILSIVGFVLLIGAVGYLIMNNSSLKKELKSKKADLLELEKVHTELDQNYEAALQDLEDLRGDNQELNELIDTQKEELAKQKKRISGLIWSERELGKAKTEMAKLQKMAEDYIAQINDLKEKNKSLSDENTQLSQSNRVLSTELQVSRDQVSELDSVSKTLKKTTEKLAESNTKLSSKVDMAEAIKINFMEVKGIDVKGNGKQKELSRAGKVDILRTCFTTETNLVTKSGEKEFYVRLTAPSGEVLYVEELGSGVLKNKLTGENVRYTTSGMVEYNNDELNACIDWKPNFGLNSGNYTVEMFHNGYNVGNGSFRLK